MEGRRARIVDLLLLIAAILGALWLAALVYHNRFGGHVERPAEQASRGPLHD